MSNFSFSHSVFKRLLLQTHKNQGLFGKGLINHREVIKGKWVFFMCNFMSIIISYMYLRFAATSPYSKKEKSLFHRYFSFSDKVFYPVAYIMNGLQHLTILTSLKFYLALMLFIWPQLLKIWPQLSPVWPQLFSFGERDGIIFFRARANPGVRLKNVSQIKD